MISDAMPGPSTMDGFYVRTGLCLGCCMTHEEAPDLIEHAPSPDSCSERCQFKRQPRTQEQLMRAIKVTHVSCSRAVRYGGNDPEVIELLCSYGLHDQCDALAPASDRPREEVASEATHAPTM